MDPEQPRSASAVAEGEVVVARVSVRTFTDLAEANPRLWRNIARGLVERLRQRNRFVSPANPRLVLEDFFMRPEPLTNLNDAKRSLGREVRMLEGFVGVSIGGTDIIRLYVSA